VALSLIGRELVRLGVAHSTKRSVA
jgi:hypothetical protein